MRDLIILLVHLVSTLARLLGPGGLRSVVAETLLVKQQIGLAFDVEFDRDVVRHVLGLHYRPEPDSSGPSWLTFLGHAKDRRVCQC